jgi:hypothetical protein
VRPGRGTIKSPLNAVSERDSNTSIDTYLETARIFSKNNSNIVLNTVEHLGFLQVQVSAKEPPSNCRRMVVQNSTTSFGLGSATQLGNKGLWGLGKSGIERS